MVVTIFEESMGSPKDFVAVECEVDHVNVQAYNVALSTAATSMVCTVGAGRYTAVHTKWWQTINQMGCFASYTAHKYLC